MDYSEPCWKVHRMSIVNPKQGTKATSKSQTILRPKDNDFVWSTAWCLIYFLLSIPIDCYILGRCFRAPTVFFILRDTPLYLAMSQKRLPQRPLQYADFGEMKTLKILKPSGFFIQKKSKKTKKIPTSKNAPPKRQRLREEDSSGMGSTVRIPTTPMHEAFGRREDGGRWEIQGFCELRFFFLSGPFFKDLKGTSKAFWGRCLR